MKIAIAGGTGVVGRHVERIAREAGHATIVFTRSQGVDLVSGEGLNLAGVDVVIDTSGPSKGKRSNVVEFFERVSTNLLNAEDDAGVRHHVALSIIGAAQVNAGYYAGKRAQEDVVTAGTIPWTILRATQFFEFAEQVSMPFGPWVVTPKVRSQPIAASSVAAELVRLAESAVQGSSNDAHGVHEIAGPEERQIAQLMDELLAARGDKRRVLELPLPGRFGRGLRDGTILPSPSAKLDDVTFEDWLAASRNDLSS